MTSGMDTTVIGVDFSTTPAKTGLALATVNDEKEAVLREVCTGTKRPPRVSIVGEWTQNAGGPVLIAIDAPLGWPNEMRTRSFASHRAGYPVQVSADALFARETDRCIKRRLGMNPMEVGADKIARTAHCALNFLWELGRYLNLPDDDMPLRLAWSKRDVERQLGVIEVYPAATMRAHCIRTGAYKKAGEAGRPDRERMIKELKPLGLQDKTNVDIAKNDHLVDAVGCVLAGRDFLAGNSVEPHNQLRGLAETEGWIWAASKRYAKLGLSA